MANLQKTKARCISFFKNNRPAASLFFAGILLYLAAKITQIPFRLVIPPVVSFLKYASCFGILSACFIYSLKAKKYIFSNLSLLALLVLGLEIVCFCLLGFPDKRSANFSLNVFPPEDIRTHLGSTPIPNSTFHDCKVVDSDTAFNVNYSFDKYYKRITPDSDSSRGKYALFFGCSICFGYGLKDNQTLPYCFQKTSGQYNAYNYAYPSYGTNHMLARLEYEDLSKQVREKDGAAFYIFFWDHIKRSIGSMDRYTDGWHNSPYYTYQDGHLVRNKMFANGRRLISKFYELVFQTSIIKYFKIDFPSKLSERHFDLVTEIIKKSKDVYEKQFGNDNFYVVFYPNYKIYSDDDFEQFKNSLKKKKIKYIDLSQYIQYGPKYTFSCDPHPNAKTDSIVAQELFREFKTKN
jgi:hypothetical protein